MMTTLSRVIKYGIQGFLRNVWLSVATIAVMVLVLVTFLGIIIFSNLGTTALAEFQDKIDISVYFATSASDSDIAKLEEALGNLNEVKAVEYISREKALEVFKEKHKDEEVITSAIAELDDNPLLASLNVKAKNPRDYSVIASYLENANLSSVVEKVTYKQNQSVIDRLTSIIETVQTMGVGLIIALALVASLVIFNTIRIAIYSNRDEISILRLVGASNNFIHGPYVVSGALYGIVAAVVSLILVAPVIVLAAPYVSVFIPSMNLQQYFFGGILTLFAYQLFFGVGLGVLSSSVAIRRYLKI